MQLPIAPRIVNHVRGLVLVLFVIVIVISGTNRWVIIDARGWIWARNGQALERGSWNVRVVPMLSTWWLVRSIIVKLCRPMRILVLMMLRLVKVRQSIWVKGGARREAALSVVWRGVLSANRARLDRRVGGRGDNLTKDGRKATCYLFICRAIILAICLHRWHFLVCELLWLLVTVAHLAVEGNFTAFIPGIIDVGIFRGFADLGKLICTASRSHVIRGRRDTTLHDSFMIWD